MKTTRERWPDLLRILSILGVVLYHSSTNNAIVNDTLRYIPRLGFLFAIGGLFIVSSIDRSYKDTLKSRTKRLLLPVWALAAVAIPIMYSHGWRPGFEIVRWIFPYATPTTISYEDSLPYWWMPGIGEVLWFISTYLWLVLLSPWMLKLYRMNPAAAVVWPIVCLAMIYGMQMFLFIQGILGETLFSSIRMVLIYAPCWMIGFARREGHLKQLPWRSVWILAGALTLISIAFWIPEGGMSYNTPSYMPYFVAFTLVVMKLNPSLEWMGQRGHKFVALCNRRAMTVYIWHNLVIGLIAYYALVHLHYLPRGLMTKTFELYTFGLIGCLVPVILFGWIEDYAGGRKVEIIPGLSFKRKPKPRRVVMRRRVTTRVPS